MDTKMNPEVKAKWLAALRSGEYAQAKARLKTNSGYCCLGVLCDLHAKETEGHWGNAGGDPVYLGDLFDLPETVQKWAGVNDAEPRIDVAHITAALPNVVNSRDDRGFLTVAQLNDRGVSFALIADLIEAHL
jgi:hypothetical protein